MKTSLAVAETFLSIQGEGHTTGKHAYFLRLAGCNLMCGGRGTERDGKLHYGATWRCDSIEVWMKGRAIKFDLLLEQLGGQKFLNDIAFGTHLIITGGEPLMQHDAIVDFLIYLRDNHNCYPICEIETNGTIMPGVMLRNFIKYWNISPKLKNSGMPHERRLIPDVLRSLSASSLITPMFKFVISDEYDFQEIKSEFFPYIDRRQVWLMPAAETREELISVSETIAQIAIREGLSFSSRLQVVIWDKKTGV